MALPSTNAKVRALVVVPAYNEQATVGAVVTDVRAVLPTADVIVVDDGSTDATAQQAFAAGAQVMTLAFNMGVGGAMRTGYRYAHRHGYDAVVQVDGDGQHDARDVPALLEALKAANIVVGSRFTPGGTYRVRGTRRAAMRVLAAVVSRVAGSRLTDVTSGLRAADRQAIALFARSYPAEYLGDTVESLVVAARAGLIVREHPVAMRPRQAGLPSQTALESCVYFARALLALSLAMVRSREAISPFESDSSDASSREGLA